MSIKYYEHSRRSKHPFETIKKIKTLLNSLNIFTFEDNHDLNRNDFFSCSILLGDNDLYKMPILSNGKGISLSYAFASGYAEFMERLQNNFLYHKILLRYGNKLKNKLLKYKYAPDEIHIKYLKCIEENKWLKEFFNNKELITYFEPFLSRNEEITCLPFYEVYSKKIVNLPADFIYFNSGSNGMASGNTIKEALLQGLCEIFERYAMRTIYFNRITPPDIPRAKFKDYDIYEKINSFEIEYKKNIIIKDCSLGKNLPVLAVLMVDQKDNSYAINFGSDPSPIIALERCMSELMQGDYNYKTNKFQFEEINKDNRHELYNYHKIFTSNSGVWPDNFFSTEWSYKFLDFDSIFHNSNDYKPLVEKVRNLGRL